MQILGSRISYYRGSMTYRVHYSMNGLTKVKIALVYARNGIRDNIGMDFRSTYVNQSYTLTGDGHVDFIVPYIDARRYALTSEDMGEFAIVVLSPPYSTSGVANSSYAHFLVTKRFNNDVELYGPRPDTYSYQSDIQAVNPPQTLSLQPLSHVKDLLLVGQKPTWYQTANEYYRYVIKTKRMNFESLFALSRSAYRFHIYTRDNHPLFISSNIYNAHGEHNSFNSYIPYVPGNSQNGITVETPRYHTTNFDVNHSTLNQPVYDLALLRDDAMDGTTIYISQSVSDEAMYTWFQIPSQARLNESVQPYPSKLVLPPYVEE